MRLRLTLAALLLITSLSLSATTYNWAFNSPAGAIPCGATYCSQSFTSDTGNKLITAYGYDFSNVKSQLYVKTAGGDETGLGLVNDTSGPNDEIDSKHYVQLDFGAVKSLNPSSVSMVIGSVQTSPAQETWILWGSNTLGQKGVQVATGVTDYPNAISVSSYLGTYSYLSVSAGVNDVLINSVAAVASGTPPPVPEPASIFLFGTGVLALGRRLRGKLSR